MTLGVLQRRKSTLEAGYKFIKTQNTDSCFTICTENENDPLN